MVTPDLEQGLHLLDADDVGGSGDLAEHPPADDRPSLDDAPVDTDLESLRSEFVAAFNARDLEAILALVSAEVECPDRRASGAGALAEELVAIWDRSPGAMLTDALLDGMPCAVAWLPDEDGCWSRAALVCLDGEDGLLTTFELPDDAHALERAEADDPEGEELDQGLAWVEWDTGEMPAAAPRR
jgi:hypothetical protein